MSRQPEPESEAKIPQWVQVVRSWQESGLSQMEYCRREGVKKSTLSRWKQQWQQEQASRSVEPGALALRETGPCFVEVARPLDLEAGGLALSRFEVLVRGGRTIRLDPCFDAAGLRRLVEVLESLPC
jgi:transposase-like protein